MTSISWKFLSYLNESVKFNYIIKFFELRKCNSSLHYFICNIFQQFRKQNLYNAQNNIRPFIHYFWINVSSKHSLLFFNLKTCLLYVIDFSTCFTSAFFLHKLIYVMIIAINKLKFWWRIEISYISGSKELKHQTLWSKVGNVHCFSLSLMLAYVSDDRLCLKSLHT